jgi:hypothetical protein
VSDLDILNERELAYLEWSSGDDCDMAAVKCVVRELRSARQRLSTLEAENERLRADAAATRKRPRLRRIPSLRTQLDTALSDLARVREECELVREAMRQAQQTATRRLDECDRMRPSDEIFETGRWYACTGCHESDEGHPTGTYNAALRCHVGGGCFECGGIGARWEQFDDAALTPKEP